MLKRLYQPAAYQTNSMPQSFWALSAATLPDCDHLPEDGTVTADVAIIGGGYTGLSAALELAENGVDVAVFDAGRSGWGASGRNGGFCCMGGSGKSYAQLAKQFGDNQTRHFAKLQRAAIDLVASRLEEWNVDADRHSDGEVILAHKANRVKELREEAAENAHFPGIETEFLTKDQLCERGLDARETHAGLHVKQGFGLHPLKYLAGLHRTCTTKGVRIFEQAAIEDLQDTGDGYILTCENVRISAKKVIVATNGYSAENLPDWIGGRLMPVFSGILVTRPMSDDELAAQGWTSDLMAFDSRTLLHYFRKLPDNRFMFGGRGGITATPTAFDAAKRHLLSHFHRMFPAWKDVEITHHWNGLACLSQSFRPYVGRVPGHRDVWTGLAWHGNGVALGSLAGKMLGQQILGIKGPDDIGAIMGTPPDRFPLARFRRIGRSLAYRYYGLRDEFA
ncbi:FAD-binding oxidoreductase [Thalassospira sp. MCCC 1A03138]|uniref:NAD(P)/FAD-dependent oxidoreductase n=1 Tax=Thalassospira sp. MCCC 1A03138 TaxID=1470576 RepID=UPI000A1F8FAE|nr:FAD-dependent oxidoreductase [Thalassospira sp. MCCC 1A03138]OSQ31109.1 FAD-dependent oxidoreductase [Thalassospira sp. MCCC 1A03138]